MNLFDLAKSLNTFDVPLYISEKNNCCFSIVIPSNELNRLRNKTDDNTNKETGVYVSECSCYDFYEYAKQINNEAVNQIENLIFDRFGSFDERKELVYSVFAILHEIGHVYHLLESKLTYDEFWEKYYVDWQNVWVEYQFCYNFLADTLEEKKKINMIFGEKYRNTAFEKYADMFALNHFEECLMKAKKIYNT